LRIDWHLHSHFSDGRDDPGRVVRRAVERGVRCLALTDHDTVAGLPLAEAAIREHGWAVRLVPGMELTARWDGREVHVLGLGFDPAHPAIVSWEERMNASRWARALAVLERLDAAGAPVPESMLRSELGPAPAPTRQHLARAIVKSGHARGVRTAFARFLVRKGLAHVPMVVPALEEAVEAIHVAGGIASLAHAGRYGSLSGGYVPLAEVGLDALEVGHPAHDGTWRHHLLQAVQQMGLGATSGSDDHGEASVGAPEDVPAAWLDPLLQASSRLAGLLAN